MYIVHLFITRILCTMSLYNQTIKPQAILHNKRTKFDKFFYNQNKILFRYSKTSFLISAFSESTTEIHFKVSADISRASVAEYNKTMEKQAVFHIEEAMIVREIQEESFIQQT